MVTTIPRSEFDAKLHPFMDGYVRRIQATPPGICPVTFMRSLLQASGCQTCGKCTPCREGIPRILGLLQQVESFQARADALSIIKAQAQVIRDTADCAIGWDAAQMLLEGLDVFAREFDSHLSQKRCSHGVEQALPCESLCPAHVDIPGYIALVGEGSFAQAVQLIRRDNPLPTVCALVCEHPCEEQCRRNIIDSAVNIRGIKRSAVDGADLENIPVPPKAESTGKRVAIVGGGPSGLTAAYFLQLMGHQCSVFEEKPKLGGMLRYGIPNYRFPRTRLQEDIDYILKTGVEIKLGVEVGKDISISQLEQDYDATYIAIGAQTDKKFDIEGSESNNVISAVNLLRDVGLEKPIDFTGKRVCVIGGGNVAMDCARTSVRANAKNVSIVYRRQEKDMTASPVEIRGAIEEGVELYTLQAPLKVEANENGDVAALWTQPQISGLYDRNGRPKSSKADKEPIRIPCDIILVAIGQDIESEHYEENGIATKWNRIITDEGGVVPGKNGIFSGGDCVSGPATVIKAIAAGKVAAANIDEYLGFNHSISVDVDIPSPLMNDKLPSGRIHLTERDANERKCDFEGIENCMSHEEMKQETARCLRCDHYGCGTLRGGRELKW